MEFDDYELISTETDEQEVKNAIIEMSNAKERIRGENELLKEIRKRMKDEYKIETKDLNKVVAMYNASNRKDEEEKTQKPFELFDKIFKG